MIFLLVLIATVVFCFIFGPLAVPLGLGAAILVGCLESQVYTVLANTIPRREVEEREMDWWVTADLDSIDETVAHQESVNGRPTDLDNRLTAEGRAIARTLWRALMDGDLSPEDYSMWIDELVKEHARQV